MPFTAAPHHDVLLLVLRIGVLLLVARLLGELSSRLGQPAVIGELLAGILLGPSVLGELFPPLGHLVVPQSALEGYLLEVVSLLGAAFLLLITGLETDLELIRHHARTAIGVSVGGVLTTFSTGYLLGRWLPDELLVDPARRTVFALFVATAMSISAIPVIAKVLLDLNLMRRDIGQTIIAAGLSDDTTGWILLSTVAGLATGSGITVGSVAATVGKVLGFMLFSATVGRWLVRRSLEVVQNRAISRDPTLTLVVALTCLWGALTQALRLEAVLGAFVMGILFGQMRRLPATVRAQLESIALGIFAPVFFATAGLKVNLVPLLHPRMSAFAALVILVATVGKIVGTYLGARLVGRCDHWTALSFGAGLNARGAMEIIIATVGLSLGILTQAMFSIIVLMAITTSLMAPTALRWVLRRVTPSEREAARLKAEELAADSLIAGVHRVLLPVRPPQPGPAEEPAYLRSLEVGLLSRLGAQQPLSVTLLSIVPPGEREAGQAHLDRIAPTFAPHEVTCRVAESSRAVETILDEARRDYDLLVVGASGSRSGESVVFNPLVDYLMRYAPCATLAVKGAAMDPIWPPRRILVRANGTEAARHAAEAAFALAGPETDLLLLHVVPPSESYHLGARGDQIGRQLTIGHEIVDGLVKLAEARGLAASSDVRIGAPEDTLLTLARQREVDLIVVGTHLRPVSERLFLGARVERILREAPCPVVVVNAV